MSTDDTSGERPLHDSLEEFKKYRQMMNEKLLASGNVQIQRFSIMTFSD